MLLTKSVQNITVGITVLYMDTLSCTWKEINFCPCFTVTYTLQEHPTHNNTWEKNTLVELAIEHILTSFKPD